MPKYRFRFKWDGQSTPEPGLPTVSFIATDLAANEVGPDGAIVTVQRTDGPTDEALTVVYVIGGTATNGVDYNSGSPLSGSIQIPIGQASAQIAITPVDDADFEGVETVILTIQPNAAYNIGAPLSAVVQIADDDTPIVTEGHPVIDFNGVDELNAFRAEVTTDSALNARLQDIVTKFLSTGSTWNVGTDATTIANNYSSAALLLAIRRPDDDLGINWHGQTWQQMFDKIMTWIDTPLGTGGPRKDGTYWHHAVALALIWDRLHNDMSAQRQSDFAAWNEAAWNFSGSKWLGQSAEVWDGGGASTHTTKALSGLVSDDRATRAEEVYLWTMRAVDSNDEAGYFFNLGREFHEGVPKRMHFPVLLRALQHAGYTEAQTINRFLRHLRDAWWVARSSAIGHPTVANAVQSQQEYWLPDKYGGQDPFKVFQRNGDQGAYLINALAYLPGKVDLDGAGISDQAALANSEADFFGYVQTVLNEAPLNEPTDSLRARVLNFAKLQTAPTNFTHIFCALRSWLIENAQEVTPKTMTQAGIPLVRRFWPGTLNWTRILTSDSKTSMASIHHRHREWQASSYEGGTRQNGCWSAAHNGFLLLHGGETGHGKNGMNQTFYANGCVLFVKPDLYVQFQVPNSDNEDLGGQRIVSGSGRWMDEIRGVPSMDVRGVTTWYASARVVSIVSNLTRSYNSTAIQNGQLAFNAVKVSSFIRKWVCIRRGADGSTNREMIVTYDRIEMVAAAVSAGYQPWYQVVSAVPLDIDGTEEAQEPWSPGGAKPPGSSVSWDATGPIRWHYPGATRIRGDNTVEPATTTPGNGRFQFTPLIGGNPAAPTAFLIRKQSGLNAVTPDAPSANGTPAVNPWDGWQAKTEYNAYRSLTKRFHVGPWIGSVSPSTTAASTRYLMAYEQMDASATPSTPAMPTCDAGSVAARIGNTIVVFKKENGTHSSGNVDVPAGVTLVVLVSLPPGVTRTLTPTTLTISSPERTASAGDVRPAGMADVTWLQANDEGQLEVVVNGVAGNLAWS